VDVGGSFCIDRYDASLVDAAQGRRLSASYPPSRAQSLDLFERWRRRACGGLVLFGRLTLRALTPDAAKHRASQKRRTKSVKSAPYCRTCAHGKLPSEPAAHTRKRTTRAERAFAGVSLRYGRGRR
jgi:hypothetical protein